MPNIFETIARRTVTLSPLMEGRTKMPLSEVIDTYNGCVCVTAFDMIPGHDHNGNQTTYPVLLIAEEPESFVFGGAVMKAICEAWVAHFDGDIDSCNAALGKSGGVKVKFMRGITKDGKTINRVIVPTT